jgi:hypothetical protein
VQTSFRPDDNIIVARVQIPCTGTFDGTPWATSDCNLDAFTDIAKKAAQARGIDVTAFPHHVLLIPAVTDRCRNVAGTAQLGCQGGSCWTYTSIVNA